MMALARDNIGMEFNGIIDTLNFITIFIFVKDANVSVFWKVCFFKILAIKQKLLTCQ